MDDQLPLPLTIKTRSNSLRDISDATTPQGKSSHPNAQSAHKPKPVFPFPTLAGCPGETRQNKGNQK